MKFWQRIKKIYRLAECHDEDIRELHLRIGNTELEIAKQTTINVDVSPHRQSPHQIIVMGTLGKTDYVQTYALWDTDFKELMNILKNMERFGRVNKIDAPYAMKAVFTDEIKRTW